MSLLLDADFQNQYIYIYIYIYIYSYETECVLNFVCLYIYIFLGFIKGKLENKIRNSIIFIKEY